MKEVPSANLVRLENMVMSLVRIARVVELASTEILQWFPQNVSSVQLDGHRKLAAPSVNLARLELSAASKVNRAKTAPTESIVKVKRVMVSPLRIQQNASTVQLAGHRKQEAPSASSVKLVSTETL